MPIDKPYLLNLPEEWEGERIVLRRWRDEDAPTLYEAIMASKEHLAQWLPWPNGYHNLDDAYRFIRGNSGHWSLHPHLGIALWRRVDSALLGSVGVTVHNWAVPSFELGYWLRQVHEGHGYVSEGVRIMLGFLFETLRAERVMIRCDARNRRSKAIPERLGFTLEGCLRRDAIGMDGAIRDTLVYAMIPEDYERAKMTWTT